MKTLTYLPTLLALTIQVMVSGQTQDNQDRKIRIDIMGSKDPVKMDYANSNVTITAEDYEQLLEQANDLKMSANKLRREAQTVETQSLLKHIEASECSKRISLQKFEANRVVILNLFSKTKKHSTVYNNVQNSYSESERFMKLAKEMREEANAQLSMQAKYGNMINAEVEEALALEKQNEVLRLLESHQDPYTQNKMPSTLVYQTKMYSIESLLTGALQQAQDIKMTVQQLRLSALNSTPNQKAVLIQEAISLEHDYVVKQLEIAHLKSVANYEQFDRNRKNIILLMEQIDEDALLRQAAQLNDAAERLMKISKEIREEANAQLTEAAKIGAMSNAEEAVILALGKQQQSIQVLDKGSLKAVVASR
jgi:hypothetical protein